MTQHVIEHGKPEDRAKIVNLVTSQLLNFSKYASLGFVGTTVY